MSSFAGIYEIPEVGRYLYITTPQRPPHYTTVYRWVRSGIPSEILQRAQSKELVLTFEDLISLRMIVVLRTAGFSLQHVRKVHKWLQQVTNYPRPLALQDLWVSSTDIFVEMSGLLSATRKGQYALDFVKRWLNQIRRPLGENLDLSFKEIDGNRVASKWAPSRYIILDPIIQFGSPCLEETRITTRALWYMYIGGDKPQSIANDYNIPLEKIEAGIEWEARIADISTN